jgi:cytoskeletal protein RodZ
MKEPTMRTCTILLATALALALSACGQPIAQNTNPSPTEVVGAQPTSSPTQAPDPSQTPETDEAATPSQTPSSNTPSPSPSSQTDSDTPSPVAEPDEQNSPSPVDESPAPANAEQIAASAQRSIVALPEVGPRNLTVKSIEEQEWSDSSLGCPDPAAIYLAVITPGYKIVLADGTSEFDVHTNSDGSLMVWCNNGRPVMLAAAQ